MLFAEQNFAFAARNIISVFVKLEGVLIGVERNVHIHHRMNLAVLLFQTVNFILIKIDLLFLQEVVALNIFGNGIFRSERVDNISARIEEKQAFTQLTALAENVNGVISVAEKALIAEFAKAMLIIGKAFQKQILIKAL